MQPTLTIDFLRLFNPLRLAGPIFEKELRVASRQRKSYTTRFIYTGLLTSFVAWVWYSSVRQSSGGSPAYQMSRIGEAGRDIALAVVLFQFMAAQVLAVILLGDAVRGEIRKRTLHVLAATPIRGLHIVGGKLAGGLLHVAILLAISLPLLALVRVFGGVSWDYVISGLCITCAAMVFAGALTLLSSAYYGYVRGALVLGIWYCVLSRAVDALIQWLAGFWPVVGRVGTSVMLLVNPTDVLCARSREMLAARPSTGLSSFWPVHCLILLAGSIVVLLLAARRVRTVVALAGPDPTHQRQRYGFAMRARRKRIEAEGCSDGGTQDTAPITRVEGSPIVWKELHRLARWRTRLPLARCVRSPAGAFLWLVVVLAIGVVMEGSYQPSDILPMVASGVFGLHIALAMGLAAAAAGAISKEREARTLPVLLMTPLDDSEVVRDKVTALVRGGLPFLLPIFVPLLILLLLLVRLANKVDLLTLLYFAGLYFAGVLGIVPFLLGLGLYCSVRLKTTDGAIACTSLLFWGLVLVGGVALAWLAVSDSPISLTVSGFTIVTALAAASLGLILLRAAARRLRCNIF